MGYESLDTEELMDFWGNMSEDKVHDLMLDFEDDESLKQLIDNYLENL